MGHRTREVPTRTECTLGKIITWMGLEGTSRKRLLENFKSGSTMLNFELERLIRDSIYSQLTDRCSPCSFQGTQIFLCWLLNNFPITVQQQGRSGADKLFVFRQAGSPALRHTEECSCSALGLGFLHFFLKANKGRKNKNNPTTTEQPTKLTEL